MRVTMVLRCLAMMRGGGETRHLAWMRELSALGARVDVMTGRPMCARPRLSVDVPDARLLRSPYLRDMVYRAQNWRGLGRASSLALHLDEEWFCRAAWRAIAADPPDLVHAHALHQMARLRSAPVPVVVNLPGPPHTRYVGDLRLADALVSDGWSAQKLPAMLGRSVVTVAKGVDTTLFTPRSSSRAADGRNDPDRGRDLRRPIVLTVSRLVPIKNVALLIDATAWLAARGRPMTTVIVGEGPERSRLEQRARQHGVGAAVRFTGFVPHEEVGACYRAADVFALTSNFDNSPNVVLEAMASGLPIVATDVGGVRQFVADEHNGTLVRQGDVEGLARAIGALIDDPARAEAMGAGNRRKVEREFSWRRSAEELLRVYEDVLRRQADRPPSARRAAAS